MPGGAPGISLAPAPTRGAGERRAESHEEWCKRWIAETESPDAKKPLTNREASYTLFPNHAAKRFTGLDGTSWVIIVRFKGRAFTNRKEAAAYIDGQAEQWYRSSLRYELQLKKQLCEQSPEERARERLEKEKPKERRKEVEAEKPEKPGKPEKKASTPELDSPIVIDGFPFNGWKLPAGGPGRAQLDKLLGLDPAARAQLDIIAIEGHSDRVPMRKHPGKKFGSLEELSDKRAQSVRMALRKAGFAALPEKNEAKGASDAVVKRAAPSAERARDRKVVVRWQAKGTP